MLFHRYAAYVIYSFWFPTETNLGHLKKLKLRFFVKTTDDSPPLTVVIENFILDAKGVLDFKSDFKNRL